MAEDVVVEPVVDTPAVEGGSDGKWYDTLDSDLKSHPSVTKYGSLNDAIKGSLSLETMIGKDKVTLPSDKSTPEELSSFYNSIGRPEGVDGYETPNLELDSQLLMKDNELEVFKAKAHELGLTNKQFSELYALNSTMNQDGYNSMLEGQAAGKQKTETALRTEWGEAYDAKVDGAQKVINGFFEGKIDESNKAAFGALANSKGFIQAMSEIAGKLGEDGISGGKRQTLTPDEASTELNGIIMDANHPYNNNADPEHNAAIDKVLALQQMVG